MSCTPDKYVNTKPTDTMMESTFNQPEHKKSINTNDSLFEDTFKQPEVKKDAFEAPEKRLQLPKEHKSVKKEIDQIAPTLILNENDFMEPTRFVKDPMYEGQFGPTLVIDEFASSPAQSREKEKPSIEEKKSSSQECKKQTNSEETSSKKEEKSFE